MRQYKQLKTKKGRSETGLFLVEGEKFVNEIPADWEVVHIIVAQRFAEGKHLSSYKQIAPVEVVRDGLFDSIADTVTPQGIMAVVRQKKWQLGQLITPDGFILIGENLNDPGNIGTLIRTAAAAGASGVILSAGSGDIYNPKVLRAAAGAALRLPIVVDAVLPEVLPEIKKAGYAVYAAHLHGAVLPYNLNLQDSFCFMVGNEASGLTSEASALADMMVRLPMKRDTESLNASIAGGILLYEAVRQRLS
ncbi:MAG: RNA methyltransferase [Defluviitaleaceae bacterium]|nr:RNA methyltransferase [Defluviitaleaceae bacterium]